MKKTNHNTELLLPMTVVKRRSFSLTFGIKFLLAAALSVLFLSGKAQAQTYTLSGGMSYEVHDGTTLGVDTTAGSGLRDGFANTSHLAPYATMDLSIEQKLDLIPKDETAVRLSITNIFNSEYELRDGTGIGVGAPQYGARRGVFAAIIQKF